jgi:nucleolar complex protein 2
MELAALAQKDPAFYKYLQENDKELLNFSVPAPDDREVMSQDGGFVLDGADDSSESDEGKQEVPILTPNKLKVWQQAILEVRNSYNDVRDYR